MSAFVSCPHLPITFEFPDDHIDLVTRTFRQFIEEQRCLTFHIKGHGISLLINFGQLMVMTVSESDPEVDEHGVRDVDAKMRFASSLDAVEIWPGDLGLS